MTQEEVAEKLGVKKQFISDVERGVKKVGIDFIISYAKIFNTPPDYFIKLYFRDMLRKHGLERKITITIPC